MKFIFTKYQSIHFLVVFKEFSLSKRKRQENVFLKSIKVIVWMRVQLRVYTTSDDWKFSQNYQDDPWGECSLKEKSFTLATVDLHPHGNVI